MLRVISSSVWASRTTKTTPSRTNRRTSSSVMYLLRAVSYRRRLGYFLMTRGSLMSVAIYPGDTVLTVIPFRATSHPRDPADDGGLGGGRRAALPPDPDPARCVGGKCGCHRGGNRAWLGRDRGRPALRGGRAGAGAGRADPDGRRGRASGRAAVDDGGTSGGDRGWAQGSRPQGAHPSRGRQRGSQGHPRRGRARGARPYRHGDSRAGPRGAYAARERGRQGRPRVRRVGARGPRAALGAFGRGGAR